MARPHQYVQITVVPITMLEDEDGDWIPFVEPGKEEQVTFGCFACDVGIEQGWAHPECQGASIEVNG